MPDITEEQDAPASAASADHIHSDADALDRAAHNLTMRRREEARRYTAAQLSAVAMPSIIPPAPVPLPPPTTPDEVQARVEEIAQGLNVPRVAPLPPPDLAAIAAADAAVREEQVRAAAAVVAKPPTLEERVAKLEVQYARLDRIAGGIGGGK
jgi:hypothetical protein